MSAAADYAAASAALTKPLPAYVSYTENAHMKFDALTRDLTTDLVLRTGDGKIVKGAPISFNPVVSSDRGNNVLTDPPFVPHCYDPIDARRATYAGQAVEAIALRSRCHGEDANGFDTLYIDPRSQDPVGAIASTMKQNISMIFEERFVRAGAYIVPSALYAHAKGIQLMFWFDALVQVAYSNYGFSSKAP
jgi:hypothetical protein